MRDAIIGFGCIVIAFCILSFIHKNKWNKKKNDYTYVRAMYASVLLIMIGFTLIIEAW